MTRYLTSGAGVAALLIASAGFAQVAPATAPACGGQAAIFSVQLPQAVVADGKPLAAGTYEVRITAEHPKPAVGQSPEGECWVEFVKNGVAAGREVASVVSQEDIATVAKGPAPKPDTARVDPLKGGDYLRVWINRAGTHYIINLPVARP